MPPHFTQGHSPPARSQGQRAELPPEVTKRHIAVQVACTPGMTDSSPWRGRLAIEYFDPDGNRIKVRPIARIPVMPPWVPSGEMTTYLGRVARSTELNRAMKQGPVTMLITVSVSSMQYSEASTTVPVRLTH